MEKSIVFIGDYTDEYIKSYRDGIENISPAGNKKILGVSRSFKNAGYYVDLINNNAAANNNSKKKYSSKIFDIEENITLHYTKLLDVKYLNSFYSILKTIKTIKNIIRNNKKSVDYIVFYNFTIKHAIPAFYFKLFHKKPIIVEFEDGYRGRTLKYKFMKLIEIMGFNLIDGAIIVTTKMTKSLKKNTPFIVLRGFINEELFEKRLSINRKLEKKKATSLMYSGRLDYERGIEILLNALSLIDINLEVRISGYGPMKENVERKINDLNKEKKYLKIKYYSYLEENEFHELLCSSDILVNPQRQNIEFSQMSFPSKIYDYISTGNLIISSNVSDIKKISEEMILIYENDSEKELANLIMEATNKYFSFNSYILNTEKFSNLNLNPFNKSQSIIGFLEMVDKHNEYRHFSQKNI